MGIRNSKPMPFTPRGLVDAFDATAKFAGAARLLANLVFDQGNPELMLPRPGVQSLVNLAAAGMSSPGFVSIHVTIGTRIYGLVASARNPGHDEPFCYDTATGTLIPITGITNANTPTSPATSGDWTPPTVASLGAVLVFTHPGFNGVGSNFFGVLNIFSPGAPIWSSQNTAVNGLTGVPIAVSNLNNRAYFAVANTLQYTDSLVLNRTNASQSLTIGDSTPVLALAGMPISTTSSGAISSLLVWKSSQIWQVAGDTTTNDLSENFLSLTIGTTAPRSIVQSPFGTYFLSQVGGPYMVDGYGGVRALTHDLQSLDPDLTLPFQNATTPSRWAGGYIASIYRVCGPTVLLGQAQVNDYWFDEHRRRWNGPHSFPYDCASGFGSIFVLSGAGNPGFLYSSQTQGNASSLYNDLGTAIACVLQSATFPKTGDMFMKQVVESQIELGGAPAGASYTITAQDESGNQLGAPVTINVPGSGLPLWGGAGLTWGMAGLLWASAQNRAPQTYAVPWTAPLVFEKLTLQISVAASANVQIGTFYARYQRTGYMTMNTGT